MNDPGTSDASGNIPSASYTDLIPANGRIIRNIIHGADTVMSHITHLYHLAALDFIDTSSYPGMSPWTPCYTLGDGQLVKATGADTTSTLANSLVLHYVQALEMRRKMHTAGALFSGRQPIQNAIVPGGVTTLFSSTYPLAPDSSTDYDLYGPYNAATMTSTFIGLLNTVRDFIDTTYIPDVLVVAGAASAYWTMGAGCGRLLAYGDYPVNNTGRLTLKRGIVTGLTPSTFDQNNILEYVAYSYYDYDVLDDRTTTGRHPFAGLIVPDMGAANGYSWLKAPRYGTQVCEVGPLARMVVTHLSNDQVSTTSRNAVGTLSAGSYNVSDLVLAALSAAGQGATALYSALGRHAARALEAKYVADSMYDWVTSLAADGQCYTYKRIPKQISTGVGLCEAPRGALGHWIKIEGRKIAKYQCVVPSTWNASPKDGFGQNGAIEQAVKWANLTHTTQNVIGADNTAVLNILRLIHPFDICIACAVHVVNPEGKEYLKFAIDPDGKVTKIETQ